MKDKRLSPEEALQLCNTKQRGHLKIFLGYAAGVGKTYTMLNETHRRLVKYNQNIVIGYVEPHDRPETIGLLNGIPIIPPKEIIYNGKIFKEVDVKKILELKPYTVLVDELAHTNAPGSKNPKRYMDIEELLDNGINVITTLNIQHLESLNDIIYNITNVTVTETIPDKIVENADDIVLVDITPDALRNRLKRGAIYNPDMIDSALNNFFRKGNLNALRELALRQTADEVDDDLIDYLNEHNIKQNWFANERVLVCISQNIHSKRLIRRGARMAKRFKCELFVVSVEYIKPFAPKMTREDWQTIETHEKLANQLGAKIFRLKGKSVSHEILKFANENHITQLVVGHSNRSFYQVLVRGSTLNKILRQAKNIEIHIIPNNTDI